MPYIPNKEPFKESKKLLNGYEITAAKLAGYLGCSEPTARVKLRNPGRLTTNDWQNISRRGHIPIEEIRMVFLR